jgi:hypothetical protein
VSVDLPTPPLPLVTAMTRVSASGPNGMARARPPRSRSVSAAARRRHHPDDDLDIGDAGADAAARTSRSMRSAAGHPTIVSAISTRARCRHTDAADHVEFGERAAKLGSVTAPTARGRSSGCRSGVTGELRRSRPDRSPAARSRAGRSSSRAFSSCAARRG